MRQLRILSTLTAAICLFGLIVLGSLNSCGGGKADDRDSSGPAGGSGGSIDPILVITVIESTGNVVGGLAADGYTINSPDSFIHFPVRLEGRVYRPQVDDGDPNTPPLPLEQIFGGNVVFKASGNGERFSTVLGSSGFPVINGVAAVDNVTLADLDHRSCGDDVSYLAGKWKPGKEPGGSQYNETDNEKYQELTWAVSPLVAAWVIYDDPTLQGEDTRYDLVINEGKPTKIPGTRDSYLGNGAPAPFPVTFDLFVQVIGNGKKTYYLNGKSHINDTILHEPIVPEDCTDPTTFQFTISGTSVNGGPLLSNLHLEGSLWEIGDPQAGRVDPDITGSINSIDPLNVVVNGRTYSHDGATVWKDNLGIIRPWTYFTAGMTVAVKGQQNNSDGSFYATSVQQL